MHSSLKKFAAVLILLAVLNLPHFELQTAQCQQTSNADSVLVFLRDVVKFDLPKYNVTLQRTSQLYRPELGLTETTGTYTLTCETSELDVLFRIINDTLVWCLVDVMKGSPINSSPPPTDFGDATREFMQRYSEFSNKPSLALQSELSECDFSRNSVKVIADKKFTVAIDSTSSRLYVIDTFYGAEYGRLGLTFENGHFRAFGDDRSYYRVGDPTVNVTRDQAISVALEQVKSFSYTYAGSTVKDFGIVKDRVAADLLTKSKFKPLELYPYWLVSLPLDNWYPGSINQIVVEMWAGTGEVTAVYPLGAGGGTPPDTSPSPSSSANPEPSTQPSATPYTSSSSSPAVSASPSPEPSASPSQSQQPSTSASATAQPSESSSPTVQPSASASPQSTGSPEETAGFPVQTAVAVVAVAAIVCVTVLAAWFLRKRRT